MQGGKESWAYQLFQQWQHQLVALKKSIKQIKYLFYK